MAIPWLALATLGSAAMGGKQAGGVAPFPNLGNNFGQAKHPFGGLLNQMGIDTPSPFQSGLSALAKQGNFGASSPPPVAADESADPGFMGPESPGVDVRQPTSAPPKSQGFLDAFFGSIDQSMQSPAKLLGLGLLNQLGGFNDRYGTYGLLGKGLFDAFRRNK